MSLVPRAAVALSLVVGVGGVAHAAAPITIKDGTFANWSFSSWSLNGGTANFSVTGSVGHPAPGLECSTSTTQSSAWGICLAVYNPIVVTTPLANRKFSLSLQFKSGPGAYSQGQGVSLLLFQNGNVFISSYKITNTSKAWKTLKFSGVLTPASFTELTSSGFRAGTPDLVSGVPTQLGFSAANNFSSPLSNYYDNFSLIIRKAVAE